MDNKKTLTYSANKITEAVIVVLKKKSPKKCITAKIWLSISKVNFVQYLQKYYNERFHQKMISKEFPSC